MMGDWLDDRGGVERRVLAAIRSAWHDHKDDGDAVISASMAKRVYGELKALRREHKEKNPLETRAKTRK
jgi:hypothetical protein